MKENNYEIRLEAIFLLEEENFENAIIEMEEMIIDFPEDRINLLYELYKMYFRKGFYLKSLQGFIKCYQETQSSEVLDLILNCYYVPNVEEYKGNYNKNRQMLQNYIYFYGELSEEADNRKTKVLWKEQRLLIYYYEGDFFTKKSVGLNNQEEYENGPIMQINEIDIEIIKEYIKGYSDNRIGYKEVGLTGFFYLYYDEYTFEAFIQGVDLSEILFEIDIVFFIGTEKMRDFFIDRQSVSCTSIIAAVDEPQGRIVQNIVLDIKDERTKKREYYTKEIQEYYKANGDTILNHIRVGKPKILFITSRFTTVLQNHIRDIAQSAKKLGLESNVNIEKSRIHFATVEERLHQIYELKPDIICVIDYFRNHFPYIPKEIVFITWIQDPMETVMDPKTPLKLTDRDFVLNHFTTWKTFKKLGYDSSRMIEAPIPSNQEIYKPYELTRDEKEEYSCDICFVCHASNVENYIENDLKPCLGEEELIKVRQMIEDYAAKVHKNGTFLYSEAEFEKYINSYFMKEYSWILEENALNWLVDIMYLNINQRIFRQTVVDWIIEAGYHNLKLWGNGWIQEEKYQKYAMGKAENGETLSKIYQASKIVIGNNIMTTSAARAWESMLSGSFYMSNYIPEEDDVTDIRKIIKVNEELVMYYDKQDLLDKIQYYLTHEKERQKMIEIGRKKALEKMTFDSLMKKMMKEVGEYYK